MLLLISFQLSMLIGITGLAYVRLIDNHNERMTLLKEKRAKR
jgi:hypothetical protein